MGYEQSRRDDLECLGYALIYLARGGLPWQGIKAETKKEKYDRILERKNDVPIEVLCKSLPPEFTTYMYYCRTLQFEDKPDYSQLRKQFLDAFYKNHYDRDFSLDWKKLKLDLTTYKKCKDENDSNKAECEQHEDGKSPPQQVKRNDTCTALVDVLKTSQEMKNDKVKLGGSPRLGAEQKPPDRSKEGKVQTGVEQNKVKEEKKQARLIEIKKLSEGLSGVRAKLVQRAEQKKGKFSL